MGWKAQMAAQRFFSKVIFSVPKISSIFLKIIFLKYWITPTTNLDVKPNCPIDASVKTLNFGPGSLVDNYVPVSTKTTVK